MDRTYIAIAILATTSTSACTTWRVLDDKVSLRLSALARAKPARDELPGTPHLLDDGRIGYAVDLDAACVDITYFDRVHALTRRRRLTTLGAVVILTGVALTSVAAPVSAGAVAFALGMTGAGMVLGTAVQLPSRHDASDHDERVERDAVVHANPARCQDVRLFGALRLTTPWGEHATAALDDDGVARFAVDWRGADDNAPQRRWKVFASTPHTSAEFVLAAADQSGATARIDAARR